MSLKDYFKISFKKPTLGEEDIKKQEKKNLIKKEIKSCNARLNSIITLEENDRAEDAFIIAKHFIIDLSNLLLTLYDKEKIKEISQIKTSLKDIPNTSIADQLINNEEIFRLIENDLIDEKEMRSIIDFFNDYFSSLEIEAAKIKKSELKISVPDHRKRLYIQVPVLILLVIGIIFISKNIKPYFEYKAFLMKVNKLPVYVSDFGEEKFLLDWLVLGKIPAEADQGFFKSFNIDYLTGDSGETRILPTAGMPFKLDDGTVITWTKHKAEKDVIDFRAIWGRDSKNAVAYAFTTINSPNSRKVTLGLGSDDAIKVWVNGKIVHESPNVARSAKIDCDKVDIKLRKGINAFLVKVTQNEGGWKFYFRIVDK